MRNLVRGSLKALPFAAAAAGSAYTTGPAFAVAIEVPIQYTANILQDDTFPHLLVANDRNGIGRTTRNITGDRIWLSAYVFPSQDSDQIPFTFEGQQYQTDNGHHTSVEVNTDGEGGTFYSAGFVGLTSGFGGGYGQYVRYSNPLSTLTAGQLDFLDNNPVEFRISNPDAPNGTTSITRTGPDYNPAALPGFVNNITISGGGLHPTLNWMIPVDDATHQTIEVRRVQGTVGDPNNPFQSFYLGQTILDANATSFTFSPGLELEGGLEAGGPFALEQGVNYEIGVQRDIRITDPGLVASYDTLNHDTLQGRSRTFFEFTPLPTDIGEIAVYLPSVSPDGVYHFDFEVMAETPVVIDPIIAVGYDYQIGAGDPLFASVILPTILNDDGLYDIFLWDGVSFNLFIDDALAGVEYMLGGVDRFRVLGIDQAAMLDPGDATAFMTTLTFATSGQFTGTMTPLTVAVPEPMTLSLLGAGLAGLGWMRRRRIHA